MTDKPTLRSFQTNPLGIPEEPPAKGTPGRLDASSSRLAEISTLVPAPGRSPGVDAAMQTYRPPPISTSGEKDTPPNVSDRAPPAPSLSVLHPDLANVRPAPEPAEPELPKASSEPVLSMNVTFTLDRYIVNQEDDGLGGHGVDLYMGFLTFEAYGSSDIPKFAPTQAPKHGTSPVVSGLTNSNGNVAEFRTHHIVNQELFTLKIREGTYAGMNLRLFEADESTADIVAHYSKPWNSLLSVQYLKQDQATVTAAFLAPSAAISNLLAASNSDDDYGQWHLTFVIREGRVRCSAWGKDKTTASPQAFEVPATGEATMNLQYLDGDNNIVCVVTARLF